MAPEEDSLTLTLVEPLSGQTETMTFSRSQTTIEEVRGLAAALFDQDLEKVEVMRNGKMLVHTATLGSYGIQNGELLAIQSVRRVATGTVPVSSSTHEPSATAGVGSTGNGTLDFSSLLGGGPTSNTTAAASTTTNNANPVYYPGMNLQEATSYNPHPRTFIQLLLSKEHLFKELNYYNPKLAQKLREQSSLEDAVQVWTENLVKGGIESAMKQTTRFHQEQQMKDRLQKNPEDTEAKAYFDKQKKQSKIDQQYQQMMEEYPEAMGRVLMLYVEAKINGHSIQAFCDSGAQATIMSVKLARECGLEDYIDTRFEGTAVGVGTGKIVGRIHMVQLQIGNYHFPCSLTVMENQDMPFLLGLDMMKRHTCCIDLEEGCLKFRIGVGQYMKAPFLHEKDLDVSKGGTKGLDVNQMNQEEDAEENGSSSSSMKE